jgi:hypothetical protein
VTHRFLLRMATLLPHTWSTILFNDGTVDQSAWHKAQRLNSSQAEA